MTSNQTRSKGRVTVERVLFVYGKLVVFATTQLSQCPIFLSEALKSLPSASESRFTSLCSTVTCDPNVDVLGKHY